MKSKKGSAPDLILVGIILFVLAIATLIVFKVSNSINTEFQASTDLPDRSKTAMASINNMYPGIIDNSFLLLAMGLSIGALVLASLVKVHPAFIAFFIFILLIIVFICGIFTSIYAEMAAHADYTALATQLTFINLIMQYLPIIVGCFGTLLMIVMYKASKE